MNKPRLDQGVDYERGFVDGMQYQMQSSVDKAVNRMAQPEQEPIGYVSEGAAERLTTVKQAHEQIRNFRLFAHDVPLYTTPPQRTWVGLTDDDKVLIKHDANFNQFMTSGEYADRVQQLTEARLKDLNT